MEAAYTSETLVARLHFVVTQKTKMYLLLDIIRLIEIWTYTFGGSPYKLGLPIYLMI
jgi:hypothetical protein